MQPLPIDTESFFKIRTSDPQRLYVDKTAYQPDLLPSDNFAMAVDRVAAEGKTSVILIDEYDDPVAKALKDPVQAERVRNDLSMIYGQLKDRTDKVRFLMITGVSKFTKRSAAICRCSWSRRSPSMRSPASSSATRSKS